MKVKYGPYSPSRLDVAACPLRFKREYIDKDVRAEGSQESKRGNVIHETFEQITEGWITGTPLAWQQVEQILSKKISEYGVTDGKIIQLSIKAARAYMDNPPENIQAILGTEEQLALTWDEEQQSFVECKWDGQDCCLRGKIDILQIEGNRATIIDHKTQLHVESADTFQMGFYAWMVKQFYPFVTEVNTILHFAHPDLNMYSKPTTWSMEDLKMVESEIRIRVQAIEGLEEFPPEANFHCNYCPINLECPKIDDLNRMRTRYGNTRGSKLVDAQEALEIAKVLTVVDEGRKVLNAKLQYFTKEVGPVVIFGKEIGYAASEKQEVDPAKREDVFKLLEKSGFNPWDFLDFNTDFIKSLWRRGAKPQFFETMKEYLVTVKTTRFGSRKG